MALKGPVHKIRSSIASYIFTTRELPAVVLQLDWRIFTTPPLIIVKKESDLVQMLDAARLAVLAYHMEIMRQAFYEHIMNIKCDIPLNLEHKQYLDDLGWFLFQMRNAFGHTREKLIAKGPQEERSIKIKGRFLINIPVRKVVGGVEFDCRSKKVLTLSLPEVKVNKEIKVNEIFLRNLLLLSYHILEITKKQKNSTLIRYLTHVEAAKKI